jgi:hypothetical protein
MRLLRRTLYAMAAVWAATGIALIAVPRWVFVDLFAQVPYPDYATVRVAGVCSFVLAMLMTITAQRLEEIWVFCWAFVFAEVGIALVALANALWGRPDGSGSLLWWLLAASGVGFAAALLAGLAKTGTERPIV